MWRLWDLLTLHMWRPMWRLWDLLTLLGILFNEVLAQLLKRHFKEPRPATCEQVDFCDTHGMPSSHAQLAAFVATMMTLQYVRRREEFRVFCKRNKRGASGRAGHADAMTAALVVLAWPLAWIVGISRVYLGYHSVEQVVAGEIVIREGDAGAGSCQHSFQFRDA